MGKSNIINFLLALMIILLIFKMILYKHENEPFNIMNCRKYPYLCNNRQPTKNESLYTDKRPTYLMYVLDKISPRYNPSSRNKNNRQNNRRNRSNRGNRRDSTILTRRRFFDPQANVR